MIQPVEEILVSGTALPLGVILAQVGAVAVFGGIHHFQKIGEIHRLGRLHAFLLLGELALLAGEFVLGGGGGGGGGVNVVAGVGEGGRG